MVELHQVTVSFRPRFVLQALSLSVPAGGSLALWGSNGAGKSTAFHAILDLLPYTGTITVGGCNARTEGTKVRRMIGWAPQDLAPSELTVAATVQFMADLKEAPVSDVAAYLSPFGLEGATATAVGSLSGGQRKRLSLALALLGDPPVLLLDEPTANLDPSARADLLRLLEEQRGRGKTLIMASHRLGDVARLADQVAVLEDGKVLRTVSPDAMVRRTTLKAKRLIGEGDRRCADASS